MQTRRSGPPKVVSWADSDSSRLFLRPGLWYFTQPGFCHTSQPLTVTRQSLLICQEQVRAKGLGPQTCTGLTSLYCSRPPDPPTNMTLIACGPLYITSKLGLASSFRLWSTKVEACHPSFVHLMRVQTHKTDPKVTCQAWFLVCRGMADPVKFQRAKQDGFAHLHSHRRMPWKITDGLRKAEHPIPKSTTPQKRVHEHVTHDNEQIPQQEPEF